MLRSALKLVLIIVITAPLAAQSTGTPVYQSPYRPFASSELAGSLSDPGEGFALEGAYRTAFGKAGDIGIRAGFANPPGDNATAFLVGGDYRHRVLDHSESFPLDGSFTLGFGLATSDDVTVGFIPIGITLGRRIIVEGSSVSLVPYVHPVLTPTFADGDDVLFSLGFGLDARVSPRLDLRFSAAIGDIDGISFSVAFLR
ncbi:MAG: hypothetical protein CVV20_04285 [Gemmatimonadetes bacterium HGW-Gemmatimonadetes-1]|jgi:hypothetical protein|nr:MAG: hypothetical protein CVV20_04285 [Gemmatimonadetes bacterium HGW-Gemmatimonadetes-1]